MPTVRSTARDSRVVGVLGGIVYSVVVLAWLLSRGVTVASSDVVTVAAGLDYSVGGLFLMSAVPPYLLARFSLVLPAGTTLWFLGDAIYQDLYGSHLHPLSSYLTVWPLLLGAERIFEQEYLAKFRRRT